MLMLVGRRYGCSDQSKTTCKGLSRWLDSALMLRGHLHSYLQPARDEMSQDMYLSSASNIQVTNEHTSST